MIILQLVTQQICSRVITDLTMGSSEEDQKEATTSASSPMSSTRMKMESCAQYSNVSLTSNRNNGYKACYFDVSPLSISAPKVACRRHACLVSVPTTGPCSRSSVGSTPLWSSVRSRKAQQRRHPPFFWLSHHGTTPDHRREPKCGLQLTACPFPLFLPAQPAL